MVGHTRVSKVGGASPSKCIWESWRPVRRDGSLRCCGRCPHPLGSCVPFRGRGLSLWSGLVETDIVLRGYVITHEPQAEAPLHSRVVSGGAAGGSGSGRPDAASPASCVEAGEQ